MKNDVIKETVEDTTKEYLLITKTVNGETKYFAVDEDSGGYPYWTDYPPAAQHYRDEKHLKSDQDYFKLCRKFFEGSQISHVMMHTLVTTERIEIEPLKIEE